MVLGAFHRYGYNVGARIIPKDPRSRNQFPGYLQYKLVRLKQPSGSTLIILYYQGHGTRLGDGTLVLSNGHGQWMHWAEITIAVINIRYDVLTIFNCCHAGAALRYRMPSRVNYEAHIKQVVMAVPEHKSTLWGYATGFAACLEQALGGRRTNWEEKFQGFPEHWVWATNGIMGRKSSSGGPRHVYL
ncbi:hypothetical protein F4823DRAFT_569316 [Ustulina deusta]|nr:hypothetical protein F4823DRAFT_569316 [Ustulina deusta]